MASTEYCYYATAMYDSGQSYGSNQVYVTSYGLMGDTNGDVFKCSRYYCRG